MADSSPQPQGLNIERLHAWERTGSGGESPAYVLGDSHWAGSLGHSQGYGPCDLRSSPVSAVPYVLRTRIAFEARALPSRTALSPGHPHNIGALP
jgi:hypothetical protein